MDDNLAMDLVALWQSELTAMAADREVRENWAQMLALWARAAQAAAALVPHEPTPGSASPAQPPRSAPAAAASGPGLDEIERLERRVAELEQRLASLVERDGQDRPDPGPQGGS